MKELLLEIIFTIIGLAFLFGMIAIAELLGSVINVNTFMDILINIAYIVGVLGFIYILKN